MRTKEGKSEKFSQKEGRKGEEKIGREII